MGSGIKQKLQFSEGKYDQEHPEREGGELKEKEFIDFGETEGSQA
jgi:hypothetical protein